MKKLIVLILILIITPFLIISEKTLNEQAEDKRELNSKNPETLKWEYVKDRAFDENDVLNKGYDKPVIINLSKDATYKDSVIVKDFIKNLKLLIPSIKIGFITNEYKLPYHYVNLGFKEHVVYPGYYEERNLEDGTTIFRSRPGYITTSDMSRHSGIFFVFKDDISDKFRKLHIEFELWTAIFATKSTKNPYNKRFNVEIFNTGSYGFDYGFLGDKDKFLLQKVYADDFSTQFEDYLYAHYPWRYAYSFLSKGKMKMFAISMVTAIGILVFVLLFSFFRNRKFKYAYLSYLFPMVFIAFHIINLSWIYKYLTDYNVFIGWRENIVFGIVFCGFIAIISATVLYLLEKTFIYKTIDFSFQLVLKLIFTFIALHLPILIAIYLMKGNKSFFDLDVVEFYFPWFIFSIFLSLGRGLLIYLNHISQSLVNEKDVELSQLKEVNAQAEVKLLQSQINPHFLYNALNSIASLAHKNAGKTEKMALSLSDLFKYTINRKGKKDSTIGDEVEMVTNYLEVEQIRFDDRLNFAIEVDKALENTKIPMFLIQPLIENAVKHGISKVENNGQITLSIQKNTVGFSIVVEDNGPDFPEGLVSGHGLQTVFDLLRLTYDDKASISWKNTPAKHIKITIEN